MGFAMSYANMKSGEVPVFISKMGLLTKWDALNLIRNHIQRTH